jgi:hypothetical protein
VVPAKVKPLAARANSIVAPYIYRKHLGPIQVIFLAASRRSRVPVEPMSRSSARLTVSKKAPRQNFLIGAVLSGNLPWRETLRVTAQEVSFGEGARTGDGAVDDGAVEQNIAGGKVPRSAHWRACISVHPRSTRFTHQNVRLAATG